LQSQLKAKDEEQASEHLQDNAIHEELSRLRAALSEANAIKTVLLNIIFKNSF